MKIDSYKGGFCRVKNVRLWDTQRGVYAQLARHSGASDNLHYVSEGGNSVSGWFIWSTNLANSSSQFARRSDDL